LRAKTFGLRNTFLLERGEFPDLFLGLASSLLERLLVLIELTDNPLRPRIEALLALGEKLLMQSVHLFETPCGWRDASLQATKQLLGLLEDFLQPRQLGFGFVAPSILAALGRTVATGLVAAHSSTSLLPVRAAPPPAA